VENKLIWEREASFFVLQHAAQVTNRDAARKASISVFKIVGTAKYIAASSESKEFPFNKARAPIKNSSVAWQPVSYRYIFVHHPTHRGQSAQPE